jgi:hypothetical protein
MRGSTSLIRNIISWILTGLQHLDYGVCGGFQPPSQCDFCCAVSCHLQKDIISKGCGDEQNRICKMPSWRVRMWLATWQATTLVSPQPATFSPFIPITRIPTYLRRVNDLKALCVSAKSSNRLMVARPSTDTIRPNYIASAAAV